MKRDLMKAAVLIISIVGVFTYYNVFRELTIASAIAEFNGEEVTLMYVEVIAAGLVILGYIVTASYILSDAIVSYVYGDGHHNN